MKRKYLVFGPHRPPKPRFSAYLSLLLLCVAAVYGELTPGTFVAHGPRTSKRISLTFDDGPGPYTEKFVSLLDKYNVKGTFFMLAEQTKVRPIIAKTVAEHGHEIASHTMNHTNYRKKLQMNLEKLGGGEKEMEPAIQRTKEELIADMNESRHIIESATMKKLDFCRMPHGIDRPWIKEAAKEAGFVLVNWSYGADWSREPIEKLRQSYINAIQPGAILLFHDGGSRRDESLELTKSVIKAAQAKGFEIVTLSELLNQ